MHMVAHGLNARPAAQAAPGHAQQLTGGASGWSLISSSTTVIAERAGSFPSRALLQAPPACRNAASAGSKIKLGLFPGFAVVLLHPGFREAVFVSQQAAPKVFLLEEAGQAPWRISRRMPK